MRVNEQEITFNVFNALKFPDEGIKNCSFVSTIDMLVQEIFLEDHKKLHDELTDFHEEEVVMKEYMELIEQQQLAPQWTRKFESLDLTGADFKDNIPSIEKPPILELKHLPAHVKYIYLGDQETLPVIMLAQLTNHQEADLIVALKKHKKTIGWQMIDIKGISPTLCMHKILLEENSKNNIKSQRRLNPIMKEVLKK